MLEQTKQEQLEAAFAGYVERLMQAYQSQIALVLESTPDVDAPEVLRQSIVCLEENRKTLNDAMVGLASTIAQIPGVEQRDVLQHRLIQLITMLNVIADRALKGNTESRVARHQWVGKVRSTFNKSSSKDDKVHRTVNTIHQLMDNYLVAIQDSLVNPVVGSAASAALESVVAEPLPDMGGFPRCWEILAFLLPRDARQRIYEPARAELLEDYLLSRSWRREWCSRLAVDAVFFVRTLILAAECARVLLATAAVKFWMWLIGLVVAWVLRLTRFPLE